jgi:hypothetical protein
MSPKIETDSQVLLGALLALVADAVAERLGEARQDGGEDGRYYSADDSPLPRRAFLRLARKGAFPSFRVGKKVLALRADVHAWIEAHPQKPPPPSDEPSDAELFEAAGVVLRAPLPDQGGAQDRTRRRRRG